MRLLLINPKLTLLEYRLNSSDSTDFGIKSRIYMGLRFNIFTPFSGEYSNFGGANGRAGRSNGEPHSLTHSLTRSLARRIKKIDSPSVRGTDRRRREHARSREKENHRRDHRVDAALCPPSYSSPVVRLGERKRKQKECRSHTSVLTSYLMPFSRNHVSTLRP